MRARQYLIAAFVAVFAFVSCTTKKTPEDEVRDFLKEFGASLQESDTVILARFSTSQSKELLLAGIRVLQNADLGYVKCTASYDNPQITFIDHGVKVHIPVTMSVDSLPDRRMDDSLVLVLERKGSTFVITDFQGEDFYRDYITLKNATEFEMNQEEQLASRVEFYNKAKLLQSKYDSVIWYTQYGGKSYFYVIKGKWKNYFIEETEGRPMNYAMGLVSEDGKEIVPLEFDLIGTPGIAAPDIVEVKKGNLTGYYRLSDGQKLAAAEYEWILPPSPQSKFMLVKKDSLYGWLDEDSQFHGGFPSAEARKYVLNFEFLPEDLTIDEEHQAMAEIPEAQYAAYGIIMPPSYLTSFGLFKEVLAGFTVGEVQNMAYRQYVKTNSDFMENVTSTLSTLMTTITERYLEGREEFYQHKELTFLNSRREAVVTVDLNSSGETTFRKIDSTLLEVKVSPTVEESSGMGMEDEEYNLPVYRYFSLMGGTAITPLESERMFACTERVKLDSTYLRGNFRRYDSEANQEVDAEFLSKSTISSMRDEILASYGYIFSDPHIADSFQYKKWYEPRFSSYSQFLESMSPIDRYNLIFLERIVGTLDPSFSASL